MSAIPLISLIVPTRGRPERLRQLLGSLADTTLQPEAMEVILVIDADDGASQEVAPSLPPFQRGGRGGLRLRRIVVPPGQTMGSLNMAGYEASQGRYLMLLNDDVVVRTSGWDEQVRLCFAAYPDDMLLVHVNDLVMQKHLCTFPIVSRTFCESADGICPRDYFRYRIDDHIEDCFNLLGVLGERRIVFAPNIVFEHDNFVSNVEGVRQYFSDPAILSLDAPRFDMLHDQRKEIALRMMTKITGRTAIPQQWRRRLAGVTDPFSLRVPNRQRILTERGIVDPWDLEPSLWERISVCAREKGLRGLLTWIAHNSGGRVFQPAHPRKSR